MLPLRYLDFIPVTLWRYTHQPPEQAGKVALTFVTHFQGDLCNIQVSVFQQLPGFIHAAFNQVLVWRQTSGLLELAGEVITA